MNNDLISRAALPVVTVKHYDSALGGVVNHKYVRFEDVEATPAVDAEPVRHGSWTLIEGGENGHLMECTVCKSWIFHNFDYASQYCPYCGAKMDA